MIWFDLDNTPHVPLFRPIINELNRRNKEVLLTARDFAQTYELLELYNLVFQPVGVHGGKNKIKKIANLFKRASQLNSAVKKKKISLAVSHGSRTQLLSAKLLKVNSLLMFDYEYTESRIFNSLSTYMLTPKFIPDTRLLSANFNLKKIIRYNGFKEELYLSSFIPDNNFRHELGIGPDQILVVLRPPSMVGNYHDSRSEDLILQIINYLLYNKNVLILIVNRTKPEKDFLLKNIKFTDQIRFLEKAVDGLQLLFAADITVSGGGTMNRESALLGTKTYSVFTGKRPYLDEYLQENGRLKFIENENDIERIDVQNFKKQNILLHSDKLVSDVTSIITDLAK